MTSIAASANAALPKNYVIVDGRRIEVIDWDPYGRPGQIPRGDEWDDVSGDDAEERERNVREKARSIEEWDEAKRRAGARGWIPPTPGVSLETARRSPPVPPRQIIAEMLPKGIPDIAGQFKAGKTTLGLNLADALGSGDDFLGRFPVDFPDGSIWYWNLELDESLFYSWLDRLVKSQDAAERIITEHLRGRQIDLTLPAVEEWATETLRRIQAKAWIIDPKGRLLRSENDNSEYNAWFRAVERIARNADLDLVTTFTHTGHGSPGQEDAIPRARGASAQLGNSDANLSYRHGGDLGGYPPDDRRYLSGFGRGVDLREITLDFDSGTGRLHAVDNAPGRSADKDRRLADMAVDALILSGEDRLNTTDLQKAIGGKAENRPKAIRAAVAAGRIVVTKEGRSVWHSMPDDEPKVRVSRR